MSLVIATPERIVADCFFSTEGGPRKPFRKLAKVSSERGTVLYGFEGYAGCGELMTRMLEQLLDQHGVDFVARLKDEWINLIRPYASEAMESSEGVVIFRPTGSTKSVMLLVDGKGLVITLADMDFFSIGYTPATAFVTGYMFGKKKSSPCSA